MVGGVGCKNPLKRGGLARKIILKKKPPTGKKIDLKTLGVIRFSFSMAEKRLHAFISGRVQGVGFRYFTERRANVYGITGWVRNLPDGRVEVVAEGDEELLKEFLNDLKKGPPLARVNNIEAKWEKPTGEFLEFYIRRDF